MMDMTQMMEMHAKDMPMPGMDMAMMQACVEACSAVEQACTMCAGSMMTGDMSCSAMCLNCADMANTMMRMMMRPAGMHMPTMMSMLESMMIMATACADECMGHTDTSPDCAMCAEVCRQCAMACQNLSESMKSMS